MEPVSPSVGWGVLHLFCRLTPATDREAMGPDLWRLRRLQADLQAAGITLVDSYVSLTEVSEYAKGMPPERLEPRLHPRLPPAGKSFICFYPMSKRRGEARNWYGLPYEEREQL